MPDDDHDHPKYRGGTIGDRFADAGHAERPEPAHLRNGGGGGGGGRNSSGRSCAIQLGVGVLTAVALLTVPFLPLHSKLRKAS